MSTTLRMSKKEIKRIRTMQDLCAHKLTYTEAATELGVSERHAYRLAARFASEGEPGLVHRLRGKPPNFRHPQSLREAVLQIYRQGYADYGPTLFCEELYHRHGITLDHETARRWLHGAGLWAAATRQHPHRRKRPRRSAIGELVQFDGSVHDWFEGRGPICTLLHAIDDASNRVFLRFATSENTVDVFRTVRSYMERYGIPKAFYVDGGGVYRSDTQTPTQFARAMNDLGVKIIMAHSPQAKGRVERGNRTHQDRLIKAMRQEGINTMDAANAFLDRHYLHDHNARFSSITDLRDVHADIGRFDFETIFSIQEQRIVANDYTIQIEGQTLQLLPGEGPLPPPRRTVVVRRQMDGTLHIAWNGTDIAFTTAPISTRSKKPTTPVVASDHAWLTKNERIRKPKAEAPSRQRLMTPP